MKSLGKIALVIISVACVFGLSACIPPFIDGAIQATDYFQEDVRYDTYAINPEAEGGFDIINGLILF